MKILVFSDSHSKLDCMFDVIDKIGGKMDSIIHLGDVDSDQKALTLKYPKYKFYFVKGNNDYNCDTEESLKIVKNGRTLLLSHGHRHQVHWNYMNILYWAMENDADAVLFGHTHEPVCDGGGSVILFNPGSISLPRNTVNPTFGIIDISDNGIINCSIMEYVNKDCVQLLKNC